MRKLYPGFKNKAFNITYDDGVMQDVSFVVLLNRYGLKGTFNLNSALMENEFEWTHETGHVVKRLGTDAVRDLYAGQEHCPGKDHRRIRIQLGLYSATPVGDRRTSAGCFVSAGG
jgi:hypothetical protein